MSRKSSGNKRKENSVFEKFANKITQWTGSNFAFIGACSVVLIWLVTGPVFDYSDTWQLVINTGTTIVTFLMVFLIQKSQNKDSVAVQIKLNELVASNERASNRLVAVENMSEEELKTLSNYYSKLAKLAMKDSDLQSSHSIEEAESDHEKKRKTAKTPVVKK